jgi:hypothetical protein
MLYEQNGMSLWYGTPDAPAPGELVPAAPSGRLIGVSVSIGVQPIAAGNAVEVRYRVNGSAQTKVQAWLARTDVRAKSQYFVARLPEFRVGDMVEYVAVCNCAGRQVPGPEQAGKLVSSFKVVPAGSGATAHPAAAFTPAMAFASARLAGNEGLPSTPGQAKQITLSDAPPRRAEVQPSLTLQAKASSTMPVTHVTAGIGATPMQPQGPVPAVAQAAPASTGIGSTPTALQPGGPAGIGLAPGTGPSRLQVVQPATVPVGGPSTTGVGPSAGPFPQPAGTTPQVPYTGAVQGQDAMESLRSIVRAASLLDAGAIESKFLSLYANRQGSIENFWSGLRQYPDLKGSVDQLQFALQLGLITRNHPPLIQALWNTPGIASTRDLMKLDSAAWNNRVSQTGVPPGIPGASPQEQADNYANGILTVLRASFPTDTVAQIAAKAPNVNPQVSKFFANSPDFDVRKSHVDRYVSDHASTAFNGITDGDKPTVVQDVKRLQRLFQLSTSPDTLSGLVSAGLDSAHAIANVPRKSFLAMHSQALGGSQQAGQVYDRAQFINARNMHLRTTIYEAMHGVQTRAFGDPGTLKDDLVKRFPNYTELFGPLELCDCKECTSVLGAPAYLVDLLEFLGNSSPNAKGNTPLDVLIGNKDNNITGRRPDLACLPLTCENTNTTMPYVDLVNEVLESYIALGHPDALAAHDTGDATAQELDANPQYTSDAAYETLQNEVYPFTLPFNRPVAVTRTYLKHLGSSRYDVIAAFQKDQTAAVVQRGLSSEFLGFTEEEYRILTGQSFEPSVNPPLRKVWEFYGYTSGDLANWKDRLAGVPEFLQRTGIAYADLVALVTTAFINPGYPQGTDGDLFMRIPFSYATLAALVQSGFANPDQSILAALSNAQIDLATLMAWSNANYQKISKLIVLEAPDATCNLETTRLQHLDGTPVDDPELSKLHRLIRLWRKLGWSIADLDRVLAALGAADVTPDVLTSLAQVKQLQSSLNQSNLQVLVSLWSPMNARGTGSLYQKLFFNKSALNKNDRDYVVFQPNPDGSVLTLPGLNIKDHIPALLAALRLTSSDLDAIRRDTGLDAEGAPLNLDTVSTLYRYAALAKALRLRIIDLIALKTLSGSNPFAGSAETIRFSSVVSSVQASGFVITQLNYLYRHVTSPPANLAPQSTTILLLAKTLREGLTKIVQDNAPAPDPAGEVTQAKLAMLLDHATVDQAIAMIRGSATYSTPLAAIPAGVNFPSLVKNKVSYDSVAKVLRYRSVMTSADRTALLGASADPAYQAAVNNLFQQPNVFIQNALAGFLGVTDAQNNLLTNIPSLDENLNPVLLDQNGNPTTDPTKAVTTAIASKFGYILKSLLPYLITQLSHALAKQTISDALKLNGAMAQFLLETALKSRADASQPAIADVLALQTTGLTGSYFSSTDLSGTPIVQTDARLAFDGSATTISSAMQSARWDGMLLPPNNGVFTFAVRTNGTAQLWVGNQTMLQLTLDPPTNQLVSGPIPLKAGQLYYLRLEVTQISAQNAPVQLFWQSASTPKAIIPSESLYPSALLDTFAATFTLLHKAALFVNTFKLSDRELAYLSAPPPASTDLPKLDLNALPLVRDSSNASQVKQIDENTAGLFAAWQRVSNFVTLRNSLPQGEVTLPDVFASPSFDDAQTKLAQTTGWDPQIVTVLVSAAQTGQQPDGTGFNLNLAELQNELWPARLQVCTRLIKRLGVSASQLFTWASLDSDFGTLDGIAQDIKNTVQAKYDEQTWLTVAKPLNDLLRDSQRAALIAYLLPRMNLTDSNRLFEYFLIDAEMGVCMETSRVVQAISSVQLFVQRCLLGIEEIPNDPLSVSPSQIDADQWQQWRKQYRVWQANRKVFLYPENWLESELRDDKSPFFKEFESALLQNELTTDNAEAAFLEYLEKLDQVARLEIMGMYWQDVDPDTHEQVHILHVFGRTFNAPHVYFYRRLLNSTTWTPWEKMQADIQGDHLIPVIWNRRLYVFWPQFAKKADPPVASSTNICLPNPAAPGSPQTKADKAAADAANADKVRSDAKLAADKAGQDYVDALNQARDSLRAIFAGISGEADRERKAEEMAAPLKELAVAAYAFYNAASVAADKAEELAKTLADAAASDNPCGSISTPSPASLYWEVSLNWSEYRHGKWSPKQVAKQNLQIKGDDFIDDDPTKYSHYPYFFRTEVATDASGLPTDLLIHCLFFGSALVVVGTFAVGGCTGETITVDPDHSVIQNPVKPNWSTIEAMTFAQTPGHSDLTMTGQDGSSITYLNGAPSLYKLLYPHQFRHYLLQGPFFYQDRTRSYFVAPNEHSMTEQIGNAAYVGSYGVLAYVNVQLPTASAATPTQASTLPMANINQYGPFSVTLTGGAGLTARSNVGSNPQWNNASGPPGSLPTRSLPASTGVSGSNPQWNAPSGSAGSLPTRTLPSPTATASSLTTSVQTSWGGVANAQQSAWGHALAMGSETAAPPQTNLQFNTFYHPFVCEFTKSLTRCGIPGLLTLANQTFVDQQTFVQYVQDTTPTCTPTYCTASGTFRAEQRTGTIFEIEYNPLGNVQVPYPKQNVDFSYGGAYSVYNWELFFHAPMLIATRLTQNQRFADARTWFHYVFNPTNDNPDEVSPARYWNVLPFKTSSSDRIEDLLLALDNGDPALIQELTDWSSNPFQPYQIARQRSIAFQKNVFMKYLDNLIGWGDQLFGQDSMETVNEAEQLYILAADLLGPRPQQVPMRGKPNPETYTSLKGKLDGFSNTQVQLENEFPYSGGMSSDPNSQSGGLLGLSKTSYFCTPQNDKLLGYWDTVADRLFKIRNCMNLQGVVRQLPLFAPPIDPALLVQAAARGVDLSSVLGDIGAPLPNYRFNYMLQKALEMCAECRSFGGALLAALEKNDAEALAVCRATQETNIQTLMKQIKSLQSDEAQAQVQALQKSRLIAKARYQYYQLLLTGALPEVPDLDGTNAPNIPIPAVPTQPTLTGDSGTRLLKEEQSELDSSHSARDWQVLASTMEILAGTSHYIPTLTAHGHFWGLGVSIAFGGQHVGPALAAVARQQQNLAAQDTYDASHAGKLASYFRRQQEWQQQSNLAAVEIMQIDQQTLAAQIRSSIADYELNTLYPQQLQNAQDIQDFLTDKKYTNQELYGWMISDISTTYFQCYQMAYDLAKKAEKTFRFERGVTDSNFIQFGYWDSLRKGLQSGERLYLALKQMEKAYVDQNKREYEITKNVSLMLHDPLALIALKETGQCELLLPEALFDADYPGHYMRRIKSAGVSIPCVVGPYTSINCTLTLLSNKTRINSLSGGQYAEDTDNGDARFVTDFAALQSIATSHAQNDSGMFELNFRDERYLPFEGAGVISRWRIELPADTNAFDFNTLTDVVFHLKYTAREGGDILRHAAKTARQLLLADDQNAPLARLFSLKHEFPSNWYRFLQPTGPNAASLTMDLGYERFPFQFRGQSINTSQVDVFMSLRDPPALSAYQASTPLTVSLAANDATASGALNSDPAILNGMPHLSLGLNTQVPVSLVLSIPQADLQKVADAIDDLVIICHYSVNQKAGQ